MMEVSNADRISMFLLVILGSTPVEIAKSSPPSAMALRSQAKMSPMGSKERTKNPMITESVNVGLERLPKDQCVSWDNWASVAK